MGLEIQNNFIIHLLYICVWLLSKGGAATILLHENRNAKHQNRLIKVPLV